MAIEHPKHAVGFVADLDIGVCDPGILHIFAPALHLAASVFDVVAVARLGYLIRLRRAQIYSHTPKIFKS
jgi:hypothetical protein